MRRQMHDRRERTQMALQRHQEDIYELHVHQMRGRMDCVPEWRLPKRSQVGRESEYQVQGMPAQEQEKSEVWQWSENQVALAPLHGKGLQGHVRI